MKKHLLSLITTTLIGIASAFAQSGTWGENLTWNLEDSTLTISGTGAMPDYECYYCAPWYEYGESINAVIIEAGVTTIGEEAFSDCRKAVSISIPSSVTTIGLSAFEHCESLTSITIPSGVTTIGEKAFSDCRKLVSISIPSGVTTIGFSAFYDCESLTSITIPSSVTTIGNQAFFGCHSLTSIDVENGNSAYVSENGVLFNKDMTFLICCPPKKTGAYVIPNSVTIIRSFAFSGCSSLTSISIPGSVTTIGSFAFRGCSGLTSITIPGSVTEIYTFAFLGCSGLTSITIPHGVTAIEQFVFAGCSKLTSITIPNSVTTIEDSAFEYCSSLTSIFIPSSVTTIEKSAFGDCDSLVSIDIENGNSAYASVNGVLFNKDKTTLLFYPKGRQGAYVIPGGVTTIGEDAFWKCSGLTSIFIPSSVTTIGGRAFWGCSGINSIDVENGNSAYASEDGVLFNEDKTILLLYPNGKQGAYVIPNSVTTIGRAFWKCSGLTSINLSNGVTTIEYNAFRDCFSLTSIFIPSSVTTIENGAFGECDSLVSIDIENGNSAYSSVNGVLLDKDKTTLIWCPRGKTGSYVIPNSVTTIGNYAFEKCSSLTSIDVENGNSAYVSKKGVLFNKNKTTLIRCPQGKKGAYVIPSNVTTIERQAFYKCSSLTSISLPNSVTKIEYDAFGGCSGLTSIINRNPVPVKIGYVFDNVNQKACTLKVPKKAVAAYKNAKGWKEFNVVN